jgi:Tfp pilus assembly protein PilZ
MTEFFVEGAAFLGTIRNESRGGLYVQTAGPFATGQEVTLTYTTPSGMDLKRTGKIINLYPDGIGIQFDWPGYNR